MTGENAVRSLLEQVRAQTTMSAGTRQHFDVVERSTTVDEGAAALGQLIAELDRYADLGRMAHQALGDQATAEGIAQLRSQAVAGAKYTEQLIEETVQAKTAVMSDSFTQEKADAYRQRLQRMAVVDFDFVIEQHDDWTTQRSETFTPGRRVPAVNPTTGKAGENPHLTITEREA